MLKTTPDALLSSLKQRGFQAESADQTLEAVAQSSGKQASDVLFAVLPAR